MNNLIVLFFEFFKVGLLTFGGGYASLPFLYNMVDIYSWFSYNQLTQLIAISGLTPGPVGLNMATFAGFNTSGFLGSVLSSFALILPMTIITSVVYRLYKKFSTNIYVQKVLYVLRPCGCALLCFVGLKLVNNLIIIPKDCMGAILLIILFLMTFKCSRNPIIYLSVGMIFAIIFKTF